MLKNGFAVLGIALIGVALVIWFSLWEGRTQAEALDDVRPPLGPGDELDPCVRLLESNATLQRRVMSAQDSQALELVVRNQGDAACGATATILAPQFVISPPETERRLEIPAQGDVEAVWLIAPRTPGVFDIAVSIGGRSQVLGITVTNVLGFTARQAELLSLIATFLGPMLTAPWWFERWNERQKRKAAAAEKKAQQSAAAERVFE